MRDRARDGDKMSQIRLTQFLRLRVDGIARANDFAYRHNVVLPKRWAAPGELRVAYWQGHRLPESPFIVRDVRGHRRTQAIRGWPGLPH